MKQKEPRNKDRVLNELVNPIRKEIGKRPRRSMPVTWGTVKKLKVSAKNALKPAYKRVPYEYELCPIERAIMGKDMDRRKCPITVGVHQVHAVAGSPLDKAFARHLECHWRVENGTQAGDYTNKHPENTYNLPDYAVEFIRDVDYLHLTSN